MEKNDVVTAEIEAYTSQGLGIARTSGRAVFIKGALRGETCRIVITKVTKTAVYGRLLAVLTPSPHRITPDCPVFGKCGGCDLRHISYAEELEMKHTRVADALRRIGGLDVPLAPIIGSERTEGYRNKGIYAVGGVPGKPEIGFYRPRSHEIIPAEHCPIQAEAATGAVGAVGRWMSKAHIAPYDERTGKGLMRHIFIRHGFGTGETMLCLVANGDALPEAEALVKEARAALPGLASIVLNDNRSGGNTVLRGTFRTLWGKGEITDTLCGLTFSLSPRSFYQVNRDQAALLYEKVRTYAAPTKADTVLDLYCGTGTITLHLARGAGTVIGAEIVPQAVADAERNSRDNGITNARFICADAGQAAEKLKTEGLRPDVIVVDPPRKGLDTATTDAIAELSPKRIVYVSCDPATLARDLKRLTENGYAPKEATPVDMFPRCAHVETVVLLQRRDT